MCPELQRQSPRGAPVDPASTIPSSLIGSLPKAVQSPLGQRLGTTTNFHKNVDIVRLRDAMTRR